MDIFFLLFLLLSLLTDLGLLCGLIGLPSRKPQSWLDQENGFLKMVDYVRFKILKQ